MSTGKKYLSLEEAAAILKIKTEELIRFREKGQIRGFADRGNWKFKAGDVEEFARSRQADSDPDLPIMDEDFDEQPSPRSVPKSPQPSKNALDDDDDELGRQATVIRKARDSTSDSDVRLVLDDGLKSGLTGSSAELPTLSLADSDSDVRLSGDSGPRLMSDSDSDVKLVNPLAGAPDSDSDVKLVDPIGAKLNDSDSDVRLADSDSDVKLVPPKDSDSDVKLIEPGKKSRKTDASSDSDVALLSPLGEKGGAGYSVSDSALFDDDAGITLAGDSGIQLAGDSGIQLAGESGIQLAGDSGIQLQQPADSGILLEGDDSGLRLDQGDSGIRFAPGTGSAPKLKGGSSKNLKGRGARTKDDLESTVPMLDVMGDHDDLDLDSTAPMLLQQEDDLSGTDIEVPLLSGDDDQGETSVIMFDDEDADQTSATVVKKGRKSVNETMFDLEDEVESDSDGDQFGDEELEVSDEVLGEDDELEDLDAFASDDDEFDESFESGASRIGFASPAGKIAAPQEAEWGTGFFLGLLTSTAILLVGTLLSVDLLRSTWAATDSSVYKGEFIDLFASLFK
jgi:Helix-turn-helix domain